MATAESAPPVEQPTVLDEKAAAAPNSTTLPVDSSEPSSSQAPSVSNQQSAEPTVEETASQPPGPQKTILARPSPQCQPQPQPALTSEQQTKYDELLATVSAWTDVPTTSARNAPKEPLTDGERLFMTRETLLRYLRATKWASSSVAATRIQQTLTWRREYGLEGFTADYVSPEHETGKQVIYGFDNEGRPCLHQMPSRQNTARTDRQMHSLVFMLERCIDLMPPGVETVSMLVNFNETKQGQGASVSQGRQAIGILQNHYPERLGRALISELPWYINMFFKAISALIDPVTKAKMRFNEPLTDHIPREQLWTELGGDVSFEYDHSVYWPSLNNLADERRKAMFERWESAGKKVGESEFYLRGAEGAVSLFASNDDKPVEDIVEKLDETKIEA